MGLQQKINKYFVRLLITKLLVIGLGKIIIYARKKNTVSVFFSFYILIYTTGFLVDFP